MIARLSVFPILSLLLASPVLAQEAAGDARLQLHGSPKPLLEGAVTSDWPRFLGPTDDCRSPETKLLASLPQTGPPLLWELAKGEGYASPVIVEGKLVLFHRLDGDEMVECREAETGSPLWEHRYPIDYRDRYGYSNGPRGSAVIDEESVYSFGVTGLLKALDLADGKLRWERDLGSDFKVRPAFFGSGHSVLIEGGKVIVNVGGESACVAAFDAASGETLWEAEKEWGASYASPIAAEIDGQRRCFVFAGGESRPPHGGLLYLDPADGRVIGRFPWRADSYESVNAVTPILLPKGRVFISQCYGGGSAMLQASENGLEPLWKAPDFGAHWTTPIRKDGHLFVVSGRHQQNAELVCLEVEEGTVKWTESIDWQQEINGRQMNIGVQRGSLLEVDGRTLCLGEMGSLLWLSMTPEGVTVESRCQLFLAPQTWSLPVVSQGLLYVMQHDKDYASEAPARMLCYDLRGD